MGHFAKVVDSKVVQVIVAEPEFFDTFVDSSPGAWIQTSYNTRGGVHYSEAGQPSADQSKALRGNYAGVGFSYDAASDVFYAPQPYPSWLLDQTTWTWDAPTPMPTDGKLYEWDEPTLAWKETVSPA
tara:strand:+ start:5739 stop:6119 length:381 start_codon:yes stop_codon:yes gene_type:complete